MLVNHLLRLLQRGFFLILRAHLNIALELLVARLLLVLQLRHQSHLFAFNRFAHVYRRLQQLAGQQVEIHVVLSF